MSQDNWSNAKIIVGVIAAVAATTVTAVHYVEVLPAERKQREAEAEAAKLREELAACLVSTLAVKPAPTVESEKADKPAIIVPTGKCEDVVEQLKGQLRDADAGNRELQAQIDECWGRCREVTPKNFSLRKGYRQTATYRGIEYGLTFVDWVNRDSKDVTISIEVPGQAPAVVVAREGRPTSIQLGTRRFTIEIRNAERVNDRVGINMEEAE